MKLLLLIIILSSSSSSIKANSEYTQKLVAS